MREAQTNKNSINIAPSGKCLKLSSVEKDSFSVIKAESKQKAQSFRLSSAYVLRSAFIISYGGKKKASVNCLPQAKNCTCNSVFTSKPLGIC